MSQAPKILEQRSLVTIKLFLSLIDSATTLPARHVGKMVVKMMKTSLKKEIITTSPVSESLFLDLHKGYKHPLILIEKLPFAPFHVPFHRLNGHSPKDAERHG